MERITDQYGNLCISGEQLTTLPLTNGDFVFYAKSINMNNKLVAMDSSKPYKILNESNPMGTCVKQGNYAVISPLLSIYTGEM